MTWRQRSIQFSWKSIPKLNLNIVKGYLSQIVQGLLGVVLALLNKNNLSFLFLRYLQLTDGHKMHMSWRQVGDFISRTFTQGRYVLQAVRSTCSTSQCKHNSGSFSAQLHPWNTHPIHQQSNTGSVTQAVEGVTLCEHGQRPNWSLVS